MAAGRGICHFTKLLNVTNTTLLSNSGSIQYSPCLTLVRTTKHWNPKFKWLRHKKFRPVILPHLETNDKAENYARLKEAGVMPPRYWKTRPITITTTSQIMDPYEPPAGDGKTSLFAKNYAKDITSSLMKKKDSILAMRKIKSYESNFDLKTFAQEAEDIYIKAHTVLMKKDPEALSEYVTERANQEMMLGLANKTLRWKYIHALEPPLVVHTRVQPAITKTNLFAQITVRFHSKQSLALYDRFGRLMYGSEILAKDVLEYVVYEKHIVNEYGVWRIHGKIIPDWVGAGEPSARTYLVQQQEEEEEDEYDEFAELNIKEDEEDLQNFADTEIVKKDTVEKAAK